MRGDRNILHNGKTRLINKLIKRYKGTHSLHFENKDGKKADCKIAVIPVSLPNYPETLLNLVVCRGLGKEPLLLLTRSSTKNGSKAGVRYYVIRR